MSRKIHMEFPINSLNLIFRKDYATTKQFLSIRTILLLKTNIFKRTENFTQLYYVSYYHRHDFCAANATVKSRFVIRKSRREKLWEKQMHFGVSVTCRNASKLNLKNWDKVNFRFSSILRSTRRILSQAFVTASVKFYRTPCLIHLGIEIVQSYLETVTALHSDQ